MISQNKQLILDRAEAEKLMQKMGIETIAHPPEQWLGVPLTIRDKTIGALVVQSDSNPNPYNQSDADVLSAVSHQIALAIDRQESEQALEECEEKYYEIVATLMEGYYETDLKGNFTFVNQAMAKMLGSTAAGMIGDNYRNYMGQETKKLIFNCFNTVYRTKKASAACEWALIRIDNSAPCYTEHSALPIFDHGSNVIGFRGLFMT